jgi:PAS domain S-box-containing protein
MPGMASSRPGSEPLNIQLLVDSIPALIHTSMPDGYLDYFNKPWLEYLGAKQEQVAGWNWTAFIHAEDVDGIVAKWRACLASGEVFEYETRVRRADGEYRWMFHRKVPLHDAAGNIVKWYGSSLDIEERKTAEELLRKNTHALQRSEFYLAEGQRLGHMGSWAFDSDGFKYWSPELFRMHGLDPAGKAPGVQEYLSFIHPHDRRSMADLINRLLAEDTPFDATKRIVRSGGEVRYIRCVGVPFIDSQRLKKYVGSAIDVTEHELLTQELRRREAYLAEAQRLSHTGSWAWNVRTNALFWSEEIFRIYGYDPQQSGLTWGQFLQRVHPDDRAQIEQRAKIETTKKEWADSLGDFRIVLPDGTIKHLHSVAHPARDISGEITEIIGTVMDVTEHELLTQELRRREAYLAGAQRLSHTGSFGWNVLSGEIFWSDETYRIFEYDRSVKPTLDSVVHRVHPEDRADVKEVIERASKTGTDFEHEYRLLLPRGTTKYVRALAQAFQDASGNLEFVGAVTDITDRKTTEDRVRRLVDAGILGIYFANVEGEIIEANQAFLQMLQYGRQDLISGRLRWADLTPAEWRERDERSLQEFQATGVFQAYEKEYFRKDGSRVPVLIGGARFQNANEGVVFVLDLSEQKRAEEKIRSSEAYLAEAQRLSQTGSWAWSPDLTGDFCTSPNQDINYWSEECYRVLGFDPQDGLPRFQEFFQRIHPEDQPGIRELIQTAVREKAEWEADYRIVHRGGAIRDIHVVGHPVLSTSGHLVEFVGTVIDVTERERAEEELRRSETELRQIVDFAPQLIALYGPNRERLYANRTALDYLGISLEEWRHKTFAHSTHPDDLERFKTSADRAFSSGAAYEVELRLRKHDGSYRWFLARYNPVRDDKRNITRWYVTATDIEDRKQAEDRLRRENVALREEIDKASMFEEIVGTSPALKLVLSRISKVAPSDSTVLITGETGTGKELVARAIHRRSDRASRAFVSVNCAAIPRDLIASEFFGHEKGAFTGATQQRLGRFELANGGTIFLDEIGELPAETQIALLRVLQEHEFERVGGTRRIRVDVRVIAATNRDLEAAINAGSFRSDLFYRLNVFPIEIPSLRERRVDIPLLVEYFIDRYARKAGKNIKRVNKKTLELFQSYPWPGNIRELQNVIERSMILCETDIFSIDENWLPQPSPLAPESKHQAELPQRLLLQEKNLIEAALRDTDGRVSGPTGAAAKLGIPRSTLESKIRSLKINKNRFRAIPGT